MAENIYENTQRAQPGGIALKEPAASPPSKRTVSVITLLTILVLLLAVSLTAVAALLIQKERTLQDLRELAQNCSGSLHRYNISCASLEEHNRNLLRWVFVRWRCYNGSLYFFSQETKPWQEAEQACVSHGVHLTSVTSQEEMEFLVRESKGKAFWIGLTDQREEGKWTWADGMKYNHQMSFWNKGQPDNWNSSLDDQEDCVHFGRNESRSWNDISCKKQFRWICKKVFSGVEETNNRLAG